MMTQFTAPTGRLVWGDPFTAQKVMDDKTNPPTPKRDAAGNEIYEFAIGVAYAKNDPLWPAFRKQLKDADRIAWPQYHGADGEVLAGVKFADKITDGDGLNLKGQKRAVEGNGYAGHWVVKYATRFAPSVHFWDGRQWVQMADKNQLKTGDYVQINGSSSTNNSQQSPGMHRNFNMVALYAQGEAIIKGPDANQTFTAPAPGTAPPTPNMVAAPPPQAGPVTPPAAPPAPAPIPPAAVHVATPIMLPAANGASYEQMRAAGWTDDQLVAHQMMAAPVAPAAPPAPIAPVVPAAPPPAAPPPAPAAPPPQPPAAVRTMTAKAAGQTYEAMIAAGWTDALLIQHGMMTA